jgi:predicted AlkP superfamily pyrophosphatase or phosphodiesterase
LSIEPFKRVFWIVLDGMGFEHARRCVESGRFPALSRVADEGILGPSKPSSPVCQTPPALVSLFCGAEPRVSGIWGYSMPDPGRPERSISGFHAPLAGARPIWEELRDRGIGYSLMNVAFRNDAVWRSDGIDFAYDGYRLWKKPTVFRLSGWPHKIHFQGIELGLSPSRGGLVVRKGVREIARLPAGEGRLLQWGRRPAAFAHLVEKDLLLLSPLTIPGIRGAAAGGPGSDYSIDANAFRAVRGINDHREASAQISVQAETAPSELSMRRKADLMLSAITRTSSRLVVGYFPIVDEFSHVYADLLEQDWPNGRVSELFSVCVSLVDRVLSRVMEASDRDALVVISSDHGAASNRKLLHFNELLAAEGLVRRAADGYDLRASAAFYHPSDCGQFLARRETDKEKALAALHRAVGRAVTEHGVEIGIKAGGDEDPYLAFLYPLGDGYFTGHAPVRGGPVVKKTSGGHHLSPLSPTPWIHATLGLWSPRSRSLGQELPPVPTENAKVKAFLLETMGLT